MCHAVHLLSSQPHLQIVRCSEFDLVQSLWNTIITGSLLKLGYPAVALSHRDPVVIAPQDQAIYSLQQVIDEVDIKMGQPKAQDEGLGGS